jgi:hypothetical protein
MTGEYGIHFTPIFYPIYESAPHLSFLYSYLKPKQDACSLPILHDIPLTDSTYRPSMIVFLTVALSDIDDKRLCAELLLFHAPELEEVHLGKGKYPEEVWSTWRSMSGLVAATSLAVSSPSPHELVN